MAKKKINSGELNLDDELDIPNFDFDFGDVPDDRTPTNQIKAGIKDGVKTTFGNTNFIRKLMRESLPPVYGEAEDVARSVGSNTSQLYNKAVREVKPGVSNIAKATDKLIPEKYKRSKGVLASIKEWSEGYKSSSFSKEDAENIRNRNIALEIGDVFSSMAQNQEAQYQESKARDAVKESVDIIRQKDNSAVFNKISNGIQNLSMYQDRVTQAFQKKSLELQYRTYFANLDSVEESRKLFALQETAFKAITKNTALPEFVKIRDSERFRELLRDKMTESLFGTTQSFISKTFSNIGKKVKEGTDTFREVGEMAAMGSEMSDMGMGGPQQTGKEKIASGGVALLAEQLGMYLGGKARNRLDRSPGVKKKAQNARYKLNNIPGLIDDWVNTDDFEDPWYKSGGKGVLKDLIGDQRPSSSVINDDISNGLQPSVFNNRNSKSLNEIIPGYLARILREVQIFRTGDESIDLISYDPYKNKFSGSGEVKKSMMDKLFPKSAGINQAETSEDIFKLIDPKDELTQEQKDAVMDVLTEKKFNGKLLSAKRLTGKSFYSDNDTRISETDSEKISGMFDAYFRDRTGGDDFETKRNKLDSVTNKIGRSLGNPASNIQRLVNVGYADQLREMGLLDESATSINMSEVLKKFTSGSINPTMGIAPTPPTPVNGGQNNTVTAPVINPSNGVQDNARLEAAVDRVSGQLSDNSETLKKFLESSRDGNTELRAFIKENVKSLTKLDETLLVNNGDVEVKTTNSILTRIEEFLLTKLPELFQAFSGGGGSGGGQETGAVPQGYVRDTLFGNLKGLVGKSSSLAWNKVIKPINKLAWGSTKLGTKLGFKSLSFAGKTGIKGTNWLANKLIKAKDIYVEGEEKPRMKMTGFAAGKYFDNADGRPIKSIHDLAKLKGSVVDEENNVVLSKEDVPKAFVKDIRGSGIISLGKYVGGKLVDLSKFTSNTTIAGITGAYKAARFIGKSAYSLLDQPIDIYLKGEDKPVLLATVMKNGGYLSDGTGKPITRPSMIDGPLKDLKGNYVLTHDQLKQGLEDIDGKPIKSPMAKLIGAGVGLVKGAVRGVFRAGKFVTDAMKGGLNHAGSFMQGMLDSLNGGTGGKKSIEILEQIRNLLDDRLPKNQKSAFNDADGDGDRDGSWKDMFSNKNKDDEDSSDDPKEKLDTTVRPGRENTFDRMARIAGDVKDKAMSALGFGDDDEEGDGVDIDIDTDTGDRRRRRGGKRSKAGKLKRLKNMASKKGALGMLGKVVGGVGKYGLMGAGALAKGGVGLMAGALPMLGSAIGAAGGAIGAAAGAVPAILAGIGAVVSSPVVIGAVAIGAAGYGAYKAFQYFTKKEYTNLVKMRMAQYGLSIDQKEQYPLILALEDKMTKYAKPSGEGVDFQMDDVLVTELIKMFEINPEDNNPENNILIKNWLTWFTRRFKPTYSGHLSALKKLNIKNSLVDIDNADAKDKELYISMARKVDVDYGAMITPFPNAKLEAGERLANAYADQALREAKEQIEKDAKDPSKASKEKVSVEGALVVAGGAAAAGASKDKASVSTATAKPAEQSGWFANKLQDALNKLKTPAGIFAVASPFASLANYAVKSVGGKLMEFFGYSVSALDAVRFKTYGIKEMEKSRVSSIRKLEKELLDKVSFNGEGVAFYNETAEYVLNKIGSEFGITDSNSPVTTSWMTWFQQRFLPVYLNYLAALKQFSGSGKPDLDDSRLSAQNKLEVANKVATTMGIWVVKSSPWVDYECSTDSTITRDNIAFLEKQAKDKKLAEEKESSVSKVTASITAVPGKKDTPVVTAGTKPTGVTQTAPTTTTKAKTEPIQESASAENNGKWDRVIAAGNNTTTKTSSNKKSSKSSSFKGFGEDIDAHITEASLKYGIGEDVLRGFIKMEAGWGNQMSPTGAIGVGQFTQGTWDALAKTEEGKAIGMTKIGKDFRTNQDPRYNKKINTLATALLAKQNADLLKKKGMEPTGENLYMVHNIGPGFINAATGGKVHPATLKAMQQNGMKPGMTPEDFIEYQKGRFNSHYQAANGSSVGDPKVEEGKENKPEAPKTVQTVSGAKEAMGIYKTSTSAAPAGTSSYAGSVERTKPNPSEANIPTFRKEKLPEGADEFASIMRKNREALKLSPRAPAEQAAASSNYLNNSVSGMGKTLDESLNVQRQMLDRLTTIVTNTANIGSNINSAPKEAPVNNEPPLQKASVKTPPTRPNADMPRAPISTARGM